MPQNLFFRHSSKLSISCLSEDFDLSLKENRLSLFGCLFFRAETICLLVDCFTYLVGDSTSFGVLVEWNKTFI